MRRNSIITIQSITQVNWKKEQKHGKKWKENKLQEKKILRKNTKQ